MKILESASYPAFCDDIIDHRTSDTLYRSKCKSDAASRYGKSCFSFIYIRRQEFYPHAACSHDICREPYGIVHYRRHE